MIHYVRILKVKFISLFLQRILGKSMSDKKAEALKILEEGLKELESNKGSITTGVQKLSRAAGLLDAKKIYTWTQIQLGNRKYISVLEKLFNKIKDEYEKNKVTQDIKDDIYADEIKALQDLNFSFEGINEAHQYKMDEASGGFNSVDFIEKKMNLFIKEKRGNDNLYYRNHIQAHLTYIQTYAHKYTVTLLNKLKFSGTITSSFDLLKNAVDDKLLDLEPELAEQLMLAFKSISSDKKEEWSQALTTCRRLLEGLADKLYPATEEVIGGRTFKANQHINRLWRFMDVSIESKSNRDLAKTHVDYLGSWLQKDYALTCKGVHDEVTQLEATRVIFHMYLMLADLLNYLDPSVSKKTKPRITTVTLDEIEALLGVNRNIAKEIIKARVQNNGLTLEQLEKVKGVGPKTLTNAKEIFDF